MDQKCRTIGIEIYLQQSSRIDMHPGPHICTCGLAEYKG